MVVVSDSSPLISLAAVKQLSLLADVFGPIMVPDTVWEEVTARGARRPGAAEVAGADWIKRHAVAESSVGTLLKQELDAGEAAALALALQQEADVVLLDERRARKRATDLGLAVVGTLGVLLAAKRQGYLQALRLMLDGLRYEVGMWLSDMLYREILIQAGEAP